MKSLKLFLSGFLMGAADIIPGVSGGTMAFITGIYDELVHSIKQWTHPSLLRSLLRLRIRDVIQKGNVGFLLPLACGIALAVLSLSHLLESLLESSPQHVSAVFFGLVAASIFVVRKQVKRWDTNSIVLCVAAAIGSFVLVGLTPTQTPDHPLFLVLCGSLAICAMILPGISGAFILLLLGKYEFILRAVNERDILSIVYIGIGCIVGLALFSHVLSWLLSKHHNSTIAVLTGFLIGSLRVLWPFESASHVTSPVVLIGLMVIGGVIVLGIDRFSSK